MEFAKVNVKAEGQDQFHKVLREYQKWNKRQPMEIATAKAYFISLNAMNTTKKADMTQIEAELRGNSKEYTSTPLAAILINKQLGKKNKKGLTGQKMKEAVEKYIRKATSKIQAVRSGWIAAMKTLNYWQKRGDVSFSKKYAPKKPQGVREIGQPKGYAHVNNAQGFCSVTIANQFGKGKQASKTVQGIEQKGLDKAVRMETNSMLIYIQKKYEQQFNKMKGAI